MLEPIWLEDSEHLNRCHPVKGFNTRDLLMSTQNTEISLLQLSERSRGFDLLMMALLSLIRSMFYSIENHHQSLQICYPPLLCFYAHSTFFSSLHLSFFSLQVHSFLWQNEGKLYSCQVEEYIDFLPYFLFTCMTYLKISFGSITQWSISSLREHLMHVMLYPLYERNDKCVSKAFLHKRYLHVLMPQTSSLKPSIAPCTDRLDNSKSTEFCATNPDQRVRQLFFGYDFPQFIS